MEPRHVLRRDRYSHGDRDFSVTALFRDDDGMVLTQPSQGTVLIDRDGAIKLMQLLIKRFPLDAIADL